MSPTTGGRLTSAALAGLVALALSAVFLSAATAHESVGPPPVQPSQAGVSAPPPAWLESGTHSLWLAYDSYCWGTMCVDFIPAPLRKDVPVVRVRPGSLLRIHLAFAPRTLVLTYGTRLGRRVQLHATRVGTWRAERGGLVFITAQGAKGEANYLVKIQLSSAAA